MRFIDILKIALKNLFRQKFRTVLTIVSMMVGAFLISVMISVGNGVQKFLVSQVSMFSNDRTISVQKKVGFQNAFAFGGGVQEYQAPNSNQQPTQTPTSGQGANSTAENILAQSTLNADDLKKVQKLDHVVEANFETILQVDYVRLSSGSNKKLKTVVYSLPNSLSNDYNFSAVDNKLLNKKGTIILTDSYSEAWGKKSQDLLGETVYVQVKSTVPSAKGIFPTKEFPLTISAFMEKSLVSQMAVITPDTLGDLGAFSFGKSVSQFAKDESGFGIIAIIDKASNADSVAKKINDLGYRAQTYQDMLGQLGTVFNVINYVLASFGAIALVVASIGIVNTLIMAVYERTREIGVMKAVGATRGVIGMMFTMEAALLGFFGGAFGLFAGWLVGIGADKILHNGIKLGGKTVLQGFLADYPSFHVSVFSWDLILLVVAVTTFVALVAGLYPALRASKLNPIEALRHD